MSALGQQAAHHMAFERNLPRPATAQPCKTALKQRPACAAAALGAWLVWQQAVFARQPLGSELHAAVVGGGHIVWRQVVFA